MSDDHKRDPSPNRPPELQDVDAAAILRRRDFLVHSAIIAAAATSAACGDGEVCLSDVSELYDVDAFPEACLSDPGSLDDEGLADGTPPDDADAEVEPEPDQPQPEVCLSDPGVIDLGPDPAPEVCLSPPLDAGPEEA